jgi:hypothetical protein
MDGPDLFLWSSPAKLTSTVAVARVWSLVVSAVEGDGGVANGNQRVKAVLVVPSETSSDSPCGDDGRTEAAVVGESPASSCACSGDPAEGKIDQGEEVLNLKRMEEKRDAGVLLNLEFELGRAASMARSEQAPQAARILGEQKKQGKISRGFL